MNAILRCRQDHPCRPVHWRWDRARFLKQHGSKLPGAGKDDKLTRTAYRLQVGIDTAKDELARALILERAGPVGLAYDIWDTPTASSGCKTELEARILTTQPYEDIAQILAIPEDVIDAYEGVFFNVTDRINNMGYIVNEAIGDKFHSGMSDRDFPIIVKGFGYMSRSPAVVNALLSTFAGKPEKIEDIQEFFAQDAKWSMARKSALAARMLPLNSFTQAQLLEMITRLKEAETIAGEGGAGGAWIANMKAVVTQIPILIGRDMSRPPRVIGAEPRVDEQLLLAAGHTVPQLRLANEFQIPEALGMPDKPDPKKKSGD